VVRVVSDEGKEGRGFLDDFSDPETETPVIVTTSQMLTTGVDAPTVRNIVLFKPIGSMTDFKQIIGRGTRVLEEKGKMWFTIIDYTGATRLFYDPAFDGDPVRVTKQKVNAETGEIVESEDSEEGTLKPDGETAGYTITPQGVTLDDGRSAAPRKFYVDGVPVYIVGEQAFELDAEENVLRTVSFTDYVCEHVRRLSPTAEHLREVWPITEQRAEIVAALEQRGIDLDQLAQMTHHENADPLDVLLHVAYNAPLVSRRERAEKLKQSKPNFFNAYTPAARAILDELLDKYADVGVRELIDLPLTLRVPPLDTHGSVSEITALFGGAEKLKAAVDQMQVLLYES
jgi:type I restriction enzyme R subunit